MYKCIFEKYFKIALVRKSNENGFGNFANMNEVFEVELKRNKIRIKIK